MHEGHRARVKKRFLEEGLDHFSDIQALELLLFYALPRVDTNPIAHRLLDRFGSLSQVLEASPEELCKVPGVGENGALLLNLIPQMGRFYMTDRAKSATILTSLEQCAEFLVPRFFGRKLETVFLLCLDAKCKVLCCKELGEGSVNSTGLSIRRVVETALGVNASSVVLAHNHPSGLAIPSPEDIQTTRRIAMALQAVEITLVDHIIVADDDYVSIAMSDERFNQCLLV
ncbi:MAG: DNA repair protein RadC [Candidatus Faecousia sp.]|nr:DNA repair protein RadC [Candidatus Faecousia sp.]